MGTHALLPDPCGAEEIGSVRYTAQNFGRHSVISLAADIAGPDASRRSALLPAPVGPRFALTSPSSSRWGMIRSRLPVLVVLATSMLLAPNLSDAQQKKSPPGLAKKGGVPPGQAKRGCLPPGLAKNLGPNPPCRIYAAVDPARRDRVWFLIHDEWVLRADLAAEARDELRIALELEIPAPPLPLIPLPKAPGGLTVLLFGS